METEKLEQLRYPTGRFEFGKQYSYEETLQSIERLKSFPKSLNEVFINFKKENLNKTYRNGGWNAKQLSNHLVDVFINAYMRTKWLLTEEQSSLKPYNENECAKLADSEYENIHDSIALLQLLMNRWIFLLESLPAESFDKTIFHPEYKVTLSLHEIVAMYAWHGFHHLAHLQIINSN
jgi:type I restriction-modification system DNA methylase subunit